MKNEYGLNRRALVKAAVVGVSGVMAVRNSKSVRATAEVGHRSDKSSQPHADIIIVGAGNAGIPAAIQAADLGAKVLMLDKNPFLGGMLNISGGHISGANSKLQIAKVIEDSPADHYRDAMRIERWACNNIGKNVCKKRLSVFKLSEAVIKALHWIIQKQ